MAMPADGRKRVVIEGVTPEIDGGRFPIKRVTGESVVVEADVFADGHDLLECRLCFRRESDAEWQVAPLAPLGNDRWRGQFTVREIGRYRYTIEGWVSRFATWRADLLKRVVADQDVGVDLLIGADLIDDAASRASAPEAARSDGHAYREVGLGRRVVHAEHAHDGALAVLWIACQRGVQLERLLAVAHREVDG